MISIVSALPTEKICLRGSRRCLESNFIPDIFAKPGGGDLVGVTTRNASADALELPVGNILKCKKSRKDFRFEPDDDELPVVHPP